MRRSFYHPEPVSFFGAADLPNYLLHDLNPWSVWNEPEHWEVNNGNYRLEVKLSGFKRRDITLSLEGNLLHVEAKGSHTIKKWFFKPIGTTEAHYQNYFMLPAHLDASTIKAKLSMGRLVITAKAEAKKVREIQIDGTFKRVEAEKKSYWSNLLDWFKA